MKYILLFALTWSYCHACLQAQHRQKYTIHQGEIMTQVIPAAERMHYEQFQPATVIYHNGKTATLTLNYSYLPGEMHLIGSKGDTLAMVDDPLVNSIQVGEDVFYYLPGTGYLLVLNDTYPVQLVQNQIIKMVMGDPQHGYDAIVGTNNVFGPSQATLLSTYKYARPDSSNNYIYYQPAPNLILLARRVSFYLMDKNKRFYEANQSTLLKFFPADRKPIMQYIQKQRINFKSKEDLIELLQYCSQLQSNHSSEE